MEIVNLTSLGTAVIVFFSAFIQGVAGFGFSIISAPLLLLIFEPRTVVVFNLVLPAFLNTLIVVQERQHLRLRPIIPLTIASFIGIPVGTYVLLLISSEALRVLISATLIVFAILVLVGYQRTFKRERLASSIVGLVSGALKSSTGMSGPPVALFFVHQGWQRDAMRATLAAYFLIVNILGLVSSLVGHVTASSTLAYMLLFIPMLPLGFYAAKKASPQISPSLFRGIAVAIVIGTSLLIIGNEVRKVLGFWTL